MIRMRAAIASTLSLALVLLSPGSSAYHAAAQTIGVSGSASSASGSAGAAGAGLGRAPGVSTIPSLPASALSLAPSLGAPSIAPAALTPSVALVPAASKAVAANGALPAALKPATAAASKDGAPAQAGAAKTPAAGAASTLAAAVSAPAADVKGGEEQAAGAALTFDGQAVKAALTDSVAADGSAAQGSRVNLTAAKKDSRKDMPDSGDEYDGAGNPSRRDGGIDEIGNPRRSGGEGGPDDTSDPDQGGRGGGSPLFGLFGLGLLSGSVAVGAFAAFGAVAMLPMILLSLVMHEIGHARVADKLGDPTSRLSSYEAIDWSRIRETQWTRSERGFPYLYIPKKWVSADRTSLNPLKWGSHVDPVWTLLVPTLTFTLTGMILGGARPVPVDTAYFKRPTRDMAVVAFAGPAVNLGLAAAGALAITGAIAAGLGAAVVAGLSMFVFLNVLLAVINFLPIPGFDGSRMIRAILPAGARAAYDSMADRMTSFTALALLLGVFWLFGAQIFAFVTAVSGLFVAGAAAVTGVKLASAFLPAVAAAGLMLGQLGAGKSAERAAGGRAAAQDAAVPGPAAPNAAAPAPGAGGPVDYIVMFGEKKTRLHDSHLSNVDVNAPAGVEQYTRLQQAMLVQLESAGLGADVLAPYNGTPLATYQRINAATIHVDGASAAAFAKKMAELGFTVYPNTERRIVTPVPVTPERMDPSARNAVTMDENLKIVKMDGVHAAATKLWGKPELGFWSGLMAKIFKTEPVQPKIGVIDSGAATEHQLLKRVKEVKNMTSGENVDDIGHGTWVHSTVLHMAPWARNTTHYKTFLNGGATLDDILRSLTQAGNDGNLVISNSWGSDDGDPNSPDSQLVRKLAQEGHIMVFAAGNAGSGKNTIGSPAIVTYKDPSTGAIRVMSVAAAGRDKKIAYFSSRGPGSPTTSRDPKYKDQRPDLTAVGYNIEGAWPEALGDADRVDGEKGPVKAISGTSMSTPGVGGALAMLAMLFGVTEKGEKLDAIVVAVMTTLEVTGQGVNNEGQGFLNVQAAYEALYKKFRPGQAPSTAIERHRELKASIAWMSEYLDPMSEPNRVAGQPDDGAAEGIAKDLASAQARLEALETEFPSLRRGYVDPDVTAYRALNKRIAELDSFISMTGSWRYGVMIGESQFSQAVKDRREAAEELKAMESADATLAYRAAGPIKRLLMKATGAAPKP